MTIYDEIFYFYGNLDSRGILKEIQGKMFSAGPEDLGPYLNREFHTASFWKTEEVPFSIISGNLPDNAGIVSRAVQESLAGVTVTVEVDLVPLHESDHLKKLRLSLSPVKNKNGGIRSIFFCALDITDFVMESAFYKHKSERLLYAAENADIGLWFWDLSEENIFTTPKLNEFFGMGPDEIMTSDKADNVIHPDDLHIRHEALHRSRTNYDPYNIEYRVIVNGTTKWLLIGGKTFPATATSNAFMMGSARDITERKLAEDKLSEIYASEKTARDSVEQANQAKDQFIAMVSHELRAPLNSVLGWVKILLTKELDDKARTNALETIERSARAQAKLINDLVDSSKIISGKLNLEFHPVKISDAVGYVVESLRPSAEAKNIRLYLTGEKDNILVNADLARLQQIFSNLMTNAVKFTPEGGNVNVEITNEGDQAIIRICDDGKGIGDSELPFIFEQFFQARISESGDKSGLGLGLSIVSTLVKQHGGTVHAESEGYGKGATFIVSLPLFKQAAESEGDNDAGIENDQEPLNNVRILLIEDNDDSREVLEIFLTQIGASVTAAASAREAMELLHAAPMIPHVMISDISMPEEDGYSLLARVRNLPPQKGGSMPAIALTAFASADDKRKALDAGFQVHHPKPFDPDVLIREILDVIK